MVPTVVVVPDSSRGVGILQQSKLLGSPIVLMTEVEGIMRKPMILLAVLIWAELANAQPRTPKDRPIRVLVADTSTSAIATRLRKLNFEVRVVAWDKVDPDQAKDIDVVFLATHWGDQLAYEHLAAKKDAFHRFVQRGGGLLASQPNPGWARTFTPTLLPFPITFHFGYNDKDRTRINLAHDHFITEDLAERDLPFPHDTMVKVDPRYHVLAKQKSTGSASLVVCAYGDGRVVVQTNNETYGARIELPDETLRRMVIWAAGKEGKSRADD
jgi:hypothetical protein